MMDFHCHLDLYPNARVVHAEAARRNAFTWLVTTSPKAFIATSKVLGQLPNILITPGLHPEIAHERSGELDLLLQQIETTLAVGEVGLDGSPRYRDSYHLQQRIFSEIVKKCREVGGRTLSIHSRRAVLDVLAELEKNPGFGTAVLHWFTGTTKELKAATNLGCWFSIGPAAFDSASGKLLAKQLPKDWVVSESDGPFAQVDGKPVMPWSSDMTVKLLAAAWNMSAQETANILDANSQRLIQLINSYRMSN
jgi:TatD DNase family protein